MVRNVCRVVGIVFLGLSYLVIEEVLSDVNNVWYVVKSKGLISVEGIK